MSPDFWLGFAFGLASAFGVATVGFIVADFALEAIRRRM